MIVRPGDITGNITGGPTGGIIRHRPDPGRREAKYILPSEVVAECLRERIRPFVTSDPHAASLPRKRYELVSLYLDSPGLDLYQDTVRGEKNRYKLRVRRYFQPGAPAFFEVKGRVNDIIRKRRAAVHPDAVGELLSGATPRQSHLVGGRIDRIADLLHFRDLAEASRASPRIRVRYEREPWVGLDDDRVRITFDRCICGSPTTSTDVLGRDAAWIPSCRYPVVLEIKFNLTMPSWVVRLIQEFNLVRTSVPKYVLTVDAARRCGVGVAGSGTRAEGL